MVRISLLLGDRSIEMIDTIAQAYDSSDGTRTTRTDVIRLAVAALYKREQDSGVIAEKKAI
jgi:hypothetical protein